MLKIMAGTTVALASVGLLLLGGCATSLRDIGLNGDNGGASSASPETSSQPVPNYRDFEGDKLPQAL